MSIRVLGCARGTGNGTGALAYKGDRMLLGKRSLFFVLLFALALTLSAAPGKGTGRASHCSGFAVFSLDSADHGAALRKRAGGADREIAHD